MTEPGPIELAAELVAAATPNPPGDERAAAAVVVEHLRRLGIDDVRVVGPDERRVNVLARVPGRGDGPTLLLNGHLDTKPPGDLDLWERPPWEPAIDDGMLNGLGAADMKGAVAAMVYAAAAIRREDVRGDAAAGLHRRRGGGRGERLEVGRRPGTAAGRRVRRRRAVRHPREWEAIRLISRGVFIFRFDVRGTQMHSSLSDALGGRQRQRDDGPAPGAPRRRAEPRPDATRHIRSRPRGRP